MSDGINILQAIPVVGVVRHVRYNGDTIVPNAQGLYVADDASGVSYDVDMNIGGDVHFYEGLSNIFPRPQRGYRVIVHSPGLAVLGAKVGEVVQLNFIEHYYAEECP